ncbi:hypothetical protein N008_17035 [Hymenobacter sp. APR13]|nr:hypothetical protein N008_17035 [Hymenobacter sp. APR13]
MTFQQQNVMRKAVMLSLPKHLYRSVESVQAKR